MVHLDARGIISVVELVVYLPLVATSLLLVIRHGFRKQAGWIYILLFSLIRIIGASMHIAFEGDPTNTNARIGFAILEAAGLSPLLLATVGFLSTVAANGLDAPNLTRGFRLLGLLGTAALILTIVGGVGIGSAKTIGDVNSGNTERHIGVILFLVFYGLNVLLTGYFWNNRGLVMKHRRKLLVAIVISLPFLAIRLLYSVLSAFSPSVVPGISDPAPNSLSKFNSTTGEWGIYLIMSVLMEFIVVGIYTFTGIITPLQRDIDGSGNGWGEDTELK